MRWIWPPWTGTYFNTAGVVCRGGGKGWGWGRVPHIRRAVCWYIISTDAPYQKNSTPEHNIHNITHHTLTINTTPYHAIPYCFISHLTTPHNTTPTPRHAMSRHAMPRHTTLHHTTLQKTIPHRPTPYIIFQDYARADIQVNHIWGHASVT